MFDANIARFVVFPDALELEIFAKNCACTFAAGKHGAAKDVNLISLVVC